jgi:hypothetical protein
MNRRLKWLGVIALLALGAAWFFAKFDRVPVTEHVPPTGEARVRDFLAAERFAERMGLRARELRSLPELDQLSPGILLVPNRRPSIDAARASRLIAWAQAGNHLVVEAELPGVDDPLLDALRVKRPDNILSLPRGKGMVSIAGSLNFARNRWIGEKGNAQLLWNLMQLTPAKGLQVFFRPERLSLAGFLVQHAALALISAGLLLALWLWRIGPRFGPVTPDAPPARRRLLDHLRASGRYYWTQGLRARLVLAARDAALRRIARSQPDFAAVSASERQARLAALAGIRPEEAAQFLAAGGAMRGHDFIRVVQRAQRVHRALDRGGR